MSLLRRFKWYDLAVVAGGALLVVYLQVLDDPTPDEDDPLPIAIFGPESEFQQLAALETTYEETLAEFEKWRAAPDYFGAFASSPQGAYGWTTRYNSEEAARLGAMAFCGQWSEACDLNAITVPVDYVPTAGITMSSGSVTSFRDYETASVPKAVASSEVGVIGWAAERDTIADAERDALAICEKDRAAYMHDKPLPDWPCRILRSDGLTAVSPEAVGQ